MLNAREFKKFALEAGADIVALGPADRLEGAPLQMDARQAMPGAKTLIGFGFRHARGLFRGIEEGTFFSAYAALGYASINSINQVLTAGQVANYLENQGYEAVPITNGSQISNIADAYGFIPTPQAEQPNPDYSRPLAPNRAAPDVFVQLRLAAVCAGLGEIGWSKMFLSRKLGPRQRVAVMLTNAEFDEYDPVVKPGTICDRCKACVKACTGGCIPREKTVKIRLAGYDVEWADIDMEKCRMFLKGADPRHNPFCVTQHDREEFAKEIFKDSGLTWHKVPPYYGYARALEGAAGCVRACMSHLEQTGRIENVFRNRFVQNRPWRIETNQALTEQDLDKARADGGGGLKKKLLEKVAKIESRPGAQDS